METKAGDKERKRERERRGKEREREKKDSKRMVQAEVALTAGFRLFVKTVDQKKRMFLPRVFRGLKMREYFQTSKLLPRFSSVTALPTHHHRE